MEVLLKILSGQYQKINCEYRFIKNKVPFIFKWLKNKNINDHEMLKTFNCGVGFCLIVKRENIKKNSGSF